jgi:hypothetical protein
MHSSSVITLIQASIQPFQLKGCSRSFYYDRPLLYGTPCQKNFDSTTLFTTNLNLCFSSFTYVLLNFTKNLKLIFSQLPFLANFASHRPDRPLLCMEFLFWLCVCHSLSFHLSIMRIRTSLYRVTDSLYAHAYIVRLRCNATSCTKNIKPNIYGAN